MKKTNRTSFYAEIVTYITIRMVLDKTILCSRVINWWKRCFNFDYQWKKVHHCLLKCTDKSNNLIRCITLVTPCYHWYWKIWLNEHVINKIKNKKTTLETRHEGEQKKIKRWRIRTQPEIVFTRWVIHHMHINVRLMFNYLHA